MTQRHSPKIQLGILIAVLLILIGALWYVRDGVSRSGLKTASTEFVDRAAGLVVSLPTSYQAYQSQGTAQKGHIGNFTRQDPVAYLTLRYDTELRKVTSLLNRSSLEHITAEIADRFPVQYGPNYRALSTKRVTAAGYEAIDHRFIYTNTTGIELSVQMLAIPISDDVAYYVILQATSEDFERIQSDMDVFTNSLKLTGPQPPTESS